VLNAADELVGVYADLGQPDRAGDVIETAVRHVEDAESDPGLLANAYARLADLYSRVAALDPDEGYAARAEQLRATAAQIQETASRDDDHAGAAAESP
jgi:hypothetical protein